MEVNNVQETRLAASEDVGKSKSEDHSIFLKPLTLEVYQQQSQLQYKAVEVMSVKKMNLINLNSTLLCSHWQKKRNIITYKLWKQQSMVFIATSKGENQKMNRSRFD
ncbi:uncharacterized protein LOC130655328 [Hydractinia symbiolongicarpus]|uniref:uncharacterized protein LOC130655328 n=1 Tax=Hydractinia symbiolongicarpus TaxID=13093 RepID=UPI00254A3168|nr:uncharacterized protein LOC130655328 [Hydractinia symbiolongicarpus]